MAPVARMDKIAFMKALDGRSPDNLRVLLWTAYWRGTAASRERIEELLNPQEAAQKREALAYVDPEDCLNEVQVFCARARSGDYMRGARDLGRKEVSGWRLTFRRLFDESTRVLQQPDDSDPRALLHLLDFTHDLMNWDYFRSQDPIEAAKIVFSDRVEALWRWRIDQSGSAPSSKKPHLNSFAGKIRGAGPATTVRPPKSNVPDTWPAIMNTC